MESVTETSPTIAALAKALAAAQGKITGALKDSANPFFKSKYADLAACWDACREPLSQNGLAVIQIPGESESGITLTTILAHESGEWVRGRLTMAPKDNTPQAAGSALTYARRYALAAMIGIAQVDDDGNAASGKDTSKIHDPKGEAYKDADPAKRDQYVKTLTDWLNADEQEDDIASEIYAVHLDLLKDSEMYNAVWAKIGAKERKALKTYIDLAKGAAQGVKAA